VADQTPETGVTEALSAAMLRCQRSKPATAGDRRVVARIIRAIKDNSRLTPADNLRQSPWLPLLSIDPVRHFAHLKGGGYP